MPVSYAIRKARDGDVEALRAMPLRSMTALGRAFYEAAAIDAFVAAFGTMDFSVVDEGHFFVAEAAGGAIVGSGGWSQRTPGYHHGAGAETAGVARPGAAIMRGVFTDPAAARQGIATAIVAAVERDAAKAGVRLLTLTATLSGIPLYEALGYRLVQRRAIDLGGGTGFGCADMEKDLATIAALAARELA